MNLTETAQVLAYVRLFDNREIIREQVPAWHTVVGHLDVAVAKRAVEMFFAAPLPDGRQKPYMDPRELLYWARKVRERMEIEEARERAKTAAIGTTYPPPPDFRERIAAAMKLKSVDER